MSVQDKTRSVEAGDLMDLVVYTFREDGVTAELNIPGDVRLKLKAPTIAAVTRQMEGLCKALAARVNAQRGGAVQAQQLIRDILAFGR